jgi:tartrate-resistant acid phosphatase type 5
MSNKLCILKFNNIMTFSAIAISFIFITHGGNLFEASGHEENKTFDIAAVGDIGCGETGTKTISSIQNDAPDLVIFLGDLAYTSDLKCFFTQTKGLENNSAGSSVLAVIGNHDIDSGDGNKVTKKELMDHYQIPSAGYYSKTFDNGNILVIAMNFTGLEGRSDGAKSILENEQYAFVKKTLENSNATYKIIASHAPFISQDCTNIDYCHEPLGNWGNATFVKYHELFKNTGVKLVLSGHNHNYQRAEKDGVTYVISGLGGRSQYPVIQTAESHFADVYGYLHLNFNNGSIVGKFIPNDRDTFKIATSN